MYPEDRSEFKKAGLYADIDTDYAVTLALSG